MPPKIISGVIERLQTVFTGNSLAVWDGLIPRQGTDGADISPDTFPAVQCVMPESGFQRERTFEDPYSDEGNLTVKIWHTTRESVETWVDNIEQTLAENWDQIDVGEYNDGVNPAHAYYVIDMDLRSWYIGQEENVLLQQGQLLYRGELRYRVELHGAVPTQAGNKT